MNAMALLAAARLLTAAVPTTAEAVPRTTAEAVPRTTAEAVPETTPDSNSAPVLETAAAGDFAVDTAAAPGFLDRIGLRTSLRAGAWTHDRDFTDESLAVIGGVRARVAPSAGAVDAFAEGYVQTDSAHGTSADLVEGWLRLTLGNFSLKAGRQIVAWGRADRLNPSDVLGSRNYTLLVANDDDQRRGTNMVQVRLGLGAVTVDGYWLPEFRDNRFPLDRRLVGAAVVADQRIDDASQFAFKIDRSGGSIDWSLAWFHGTDRTRDFVRVPLPPFRLSGTVTGIQQRFAKVDVLAADAAGTLGRIGWRAEIAWSRYRGTDTIFRKNDNVWLVAGFDTDGPGGWNLNLQYSLRHVFNFSDPRAIADPIDRAVASQSAAVNNQLGRTQHGLTARVAHKWLQDTLDLEVATIVYFQTGDAAIRPKLGYAVNDRLRITAAADIFVGPRLSYFGRVRTLSAGFLQLNYGF